MSRHTTVSEPAYPVRREQGTSQPRGFLTYGLSPLVPRYICHTQPHCRCCLSLFGTIHIPLRRSLRGTGETTASSSKITTSQLLKNTCNPAMSLELAQFPNKAACVVRLQRGEDTATCIALKDSERHFSLQKEPRTSVQLRVVLKTPVLTARPVTRKLLRIQVNRRS